MTKAHYRKRTSRGGGAGGNVISHGRAVTGVVISEAQKDSQARVTRDGKRLIAQRVLDNWTADRREMEAKLARWRSAVHDFTPLGKLPGCELCGEALNAGDENGRRYHFDPAKRRPLDLGLSTVHLVRRHTIEGVGYWQSDNGRWVIHSLTPSGAITTFGGRVIKYRVVDTTRKVKYWGRTYSQEFGMLDEARREISQVEHNEWLAKF